MAGKESEIRERVRARYGEIARKGSGCCAGSSCGETPETLSLMMGYTRDETEAVPVGADLGLGCGAPLAMAVLRKGMTVLDLGSGAGFDVFLAARDVGEEGRVIGVDMTPEMISRARANARTGGFKNVEFRLGEIEHLPVADSSVDVVISNCVLNLSPDKPQVLSEVFRVLKPGGRIVLSDVVARFALPEEIRQNPDLYAGCMAGAETTECLEEILHSLGFEEIRISSKDESRTLIASWAPGAQIENYVISAMIEGKKPEGR
ncbi:MAG: arsenite methyltransferase [Nitrospirae bacterium]|nr:arsenite methyltransferase [Nitrospirota bacterium]MCL5285864.1 arsenite methyltransferase [Nitrospirota bacterium]